jgi:hypothetical protein
MIAGWGCSGAWQRAMTLEWMIRLSKMDLANLPVLFEGQVRFALFKGGIVVGEYISFSYHSYRLRRRDPDFAPYGK